MSAAFEDLRERTLVMELLERSGLTDRLEARTDGVSHLERMASILVNPQLYDSNDLFPKRPPKSGGAARHFANAPWIYVYYGALIHLFSSAYKVDYEMTNGSAYKLAKFAVVMMCPHRPDLWLREKPVRRHHFKLALRNELVDPEIKEQLAELGRRHAMANARELGLCVNDGRGSLTHPDPDHTAQADGKVVKSRFKALPGKKRKCRRWDPEKGKEVDELVDVRSDPYSDLWITGAGEMVMGINWTFMSTRGDEKNQRIILDFEVVPPAFTGHEGGEAEIAMRCFRRVLATQQLPAVQAVIYDGALRGKHIEELYGYGVATMANMAKAPRSDRPERDYPFPVTIKRPDGSKSVINVIDPKTGKFNGPRIRLIWGRPNLVVTLTNGAEYEIPLERKKVARGDGRWYVEYTVPAEEGGGTIRFRLNRSAEDALGKKSDHFNRAEHLRAVPMDDPDWAVYGRRNDTESGNRVLDDSLPRERAHCVGPERQWVEMFTWQLFQNSRALELHRRRHGTRPPDAALAA